VHEFKKIGGIPEREDKQGLLRPDGVHLQHWPNHDNHLHVRVAESAMFAAEAFEAP
jgi:hypothetical protein